jgi:hypothetical protein
LLDVVRWSIKQSEWIFNMGCGLAAGGSWGRVRGRGSAATFYVLPLDRGIYLLQTNGIIYNIYKKSFFL